MPAQTFTTLFNFDDSDGAYPSAALIQATDGNFYGTASRGGEYSSCSENCGTVFRITPSGTLTTLYNFNSTDGDNPVAPVVQASDGNFYGTTLTGGVNNQGTIFEITSSGTLTTVYNFCPQSGCRDGSQPVGGLVQATDGNFYGTTQYGGTSGYGTVFKITPAGTLTTLYNFCSQSGCTDGSKPLAELIQAANGSLYGTAENGGANGYGTIFQITPSGKLTTLHSFDGTDGNGPNAGLVQASDGNFYGTTQFGGANDTCDVYGQDGCGTVFKIAPSGTLTTLHSFDGTDGSTPYAALIQATDGNFYGSTTFGATDGVGTLFQITPSGTLTTLYTFGANSSRPDSALIQDTNGTLYGTVEFGGTYGYGTFFSLSMGLHPFVETQSTVGKVGTPVIILGTNLTGATSVTFNGTAATFTVASSTEITTTVPAGATTGFVTVTTPKGRLKSNQRYVVRP